MGLWSRVSAAWAEAGVPEEAVRLFVDQSQPERKRRAQVDVVNVLSDHFGFSQGDDPDRLVAASQSWALLVGALGDPQPWVRATALNGLNELANILRFDLDAGLVHSAYGPVARCLQDRDEEVRVEACSALKSFTDVMNDATADWAIRSIGALLRDPSVTVRAEAMRWLADDRIPAAWDFLPWAYEWLADPDSEIRDSAVSAVGIMHLGGERPAPPDVAARIAHLLAVDPSPLVREHAADALHEVAPQDPRAVAALVNALHDPESDVRHKVIFALGDFGSAADQAVDPLLALADGEHREAVGFGLRGIGTPRAMEALRRAGLPLETPLD